MSANALRRDKAEKAGRVPQESASAAVKYVFAAILLSAGLVVFLYPAVSGLINERSQTTLVNSFEEAAGDLPAEQKVTSLEQARAYNRSLVGRQAVLADPFSQGGGYESKVISFMDVGDIMGYIEIPKIGVTLPIYAGTTEAMLQKGAGWLAGTSLPVGGASTHTVLTGHRGLPTSRLFTDINKLQEGDEFYIRNLSGILAYRVVGTRVIDPQDTSALGIVEGRDEATLLTCHPYMINSHRLLVTGERVAYTGQLEHLAENGGVFASFTAAEKDFTLAVCVSVAILGLVAVLALRSRRKKRREGAR